MAEMVDLDMLEKEFDVFVSGIRFDGMPVLSYSSDPAEDDTEVWFADSPDAKTSVVEMEDRYDVSWFAEPSVYVPKGQSAVVAAAGKRYDSEGFEIDEFGNRVNPDSEIPDDPESLSGSSRPRPRTSDTDPLVTDYVIDDDDLIAEQDEIDAASPEVEDEDEPEVEDEDEVEPEVEVDYGDPEDGVPAAEPEYTEAELQEMKATIEDAEERTDALEAAVAQSLLASVTDHLFDGDMEAKPTLKLRGSVAPRLASIGNELGPIIARVASLPESPPEELEERLDTLYGRLEALEEQIAELLLETVSDEELVVVRDSDTVDETLTNKTR